MVEEETIYELDFEMRENSQATEFARDVYYDKEAITKYRFYLLTDAFNRQRSKTIKDAKISDKTVELNV